MAHDRGDLVATRSSHGGRVAIDIRPDSQLAVATANVLPECDGEIELGAPETLSIDRTAIADQSVALESAPVVLGGGRGLDDAGFRQLETIAGLVGGAVGASLPAIDLGLAPVSRQVGQSGKFVTPRVYLAVGLSGTPQHLAGIGSATRLLAINNDPDAAIFQFAEAGVMADARSLLPVLAKVIEERLGAAK
ncbi:MAG: electron transfer flavoprotein subunit alpha/FixB family protein [Novosphingobium sp.]|nr:electron transfer flavoprotein subunit alpha/FixB family protein [Novosphingobium sp.]